MSSYPRREKRKQKSREALIQAALDLFASKGFEETTLDDIASRADLHVQTLYRHFPTKNDLAVAIDRTRLEEFRELFADRKVSTLEFWRTWLIQTTEEWTKHGKQYRAFLTNLQTVPTISTTLIATWYAYESLLEEGLRQDFGSEVDDPFPIMIACALWGGHRHAIYNWFIEGGTGDLTAASVAVVDQVITRFGAQFEAARQIEIQSSS